MASAVERLWMHPVSATLSFTVSADHEHERVKGRGRNDSSGTRCPGFVNEWKTNKQNASWCPAHLPSLTSACSFTSLLLDIEKCIVLIHRNLSLLDMCSYLQFSSRLLHMSAQTEEGWFGKLALVFLLWGGDFVLLQQPVSSTTGKHPVCLEGEEKLTSLLELTEMYWRVLKLHKAFGGVWSSVTLTLLTQCGVFFTPLCLS